jgi:cell division transport system permease protein
MRPRFVLQEILTGLRRNGTLAAAVVVTVMISLAFVGAALLARDVTNAMHKQYYGKLEVAIFLDQNISPSEQNSLDAQLHADPRVKAVIYVTHAQALANFEKEFNGQPALVRSVTSASELPASFQVQLKDPKLYGDIASEYGLAPGVDAVNDPQAILKPLFDLVDGVNVLAIVVAVISAVGALLTTFNTIRLAAFSRRREIGIMRLVGASNFTIQLPFVLEGVIAGLAGAAASCGMLALFKGWALDHGEIGNFFHAGAVPNVTWAEYTGIIPWLILLGAAIAGVASYATSWFYVRV